MGQPMPSEPPAFWLLGCFSLILWLWGLCTACHRKRTQRQQTGLQGSVMPAEASLLRQTHLCTLSKSDTRLHELHRSPHCSTAPRPASIDLMCPRWLSVSRGSNMPQAAPSAFPTWQLPRVPPATPPTASSTWSEATYSNVGMAAISSASLAASPVVWAGTQQAISCAKPGPEAEYACIQRYKGITDQGHQGLHQGKAEMTASVQVDFLYSRVCKPKSRDPGPATGQPDLQGWGVIPALESELEYEAIPLRSQGVDRGPLENVYESIREMRP